MAKSKNSTLYNELVKVSEEFFGPATDRFLTAQLAHHLHKTPEEFTHNDLPKIVIWLKLSLATISDDSDKIKKYIELVEKFNQH